MLSYRHLFHAGNFADVFKHALLARLLLALTRKDKPLCYLETHAGIGQYDLRHPWARKNSEYVGGIGRLYDHGSVHELVRPYLRVVRAANAGKSLDFYPGSPLIAQALLRRQDRMELAELNADDHAALSRALAGARQVGVHHMDGYQALRAFLPPRERRGFVLIDSSFDRAGEFTRLVQALVEAHRRFATGVYAIWYPLMNRAAMLGFEEDMRDSGVPRILQVEMAVAEEGRSQLMRGCGMLIVNPPYRIDEEATAMLPWLHRVLAPQGDGGTRVSWLAPDS